MDLKSQNIASKEDIKQAIADEFGVKNFDCVDTGALPSKISGKSLAALVEKVKDPIADEEK